MAEFDLSLYMRAPIMDVASGVALGVSLLSASPKAPTSAVKAAAKRLRTSVVALQSAWGSASIPAPAGKKRAADYATDNAWGCLEMRLDAYGRLPASEAPKAERATEIYSKLFPDGLTFLTLPFKTQWAEGEKRLQLIEGDKLAADIDLLAGPEFLREVRRTHAIYGKALGVTQPEELPLDVRLAEPLRDVGQAIVDYSLQLLALASAEPSMAATVKKALKPIDDHRAAAPKRGSAAEDAPNDAPASPDVSPKTPVPEVPE